MTLLRYRAMPSKTDDHIAVPLHNPYEKHPPPPRACVACYLKYTVFDRELSNSGAQTASFYPHVQSCRLAEGFAKLILCPV